MGIIIITRLMEQLCFVVLAEGCVAEDLPADVQPPMKVPVTFNYPLREDDQASFTSVLNQERKLKSVPTVGDIHNFFIDVRQRGVSSLDNIESFKDLRKRINDENFTQLEVMYQKLGDYCLVDDNSEANNFLVKEASDFSYEVLNRLHKDNESRPDLHFYVSYIAMVSFYVYFIENNSVTAKKRRRRLNKASDSFIYPDRVYCVCRSKSVEHKDSMIECTDCKEWFHYKCVGFNGAAISNFEQSPDLFDFNCAFARCSHQGQYKLIMKEDCSLVWSCDARKIPFYGEGIKTGEEVVKVNDIVHFGKSDKVHGKEKKPRSNKKRILCIAPNLENVVNPSKNVNKMDTDDKEIFNDKAKDFKEKERLTKPHFDEDIEENVNLDLSKKSRGLCLPSDLDNVENPSKKIRISNENVNKIGIKDDKLHDKAKELTEKKKDANFYNCLTSSPLKDVFEEHSYVAPNDIKDIFHNYPGAVNDEAVEKELTGISCSVPKLHDVGIEKSNDKIITTEDIEEILESKVPRDNVFTRTLEGGSFDINEEEWDNWMKALPTDCFWFPSEKLAGNIWQDIFLAGMKKLNRFCSLCFKRHYISNPHQRARKRNVPLFKAIGYCNHGKKDKFVENCPVKFELIMWSVPTVEVTWSGDVRHHVSSNGARPIRGKARERLRELFKHGEKPFKKFVTTSSSKDKDVLMAGNCDEVGRSTAVLRKIASESRQEGRCDKDTALSLEKMKADMCSKYVSSSKVPGFIQDIGLDPLFIHFYSHKSILLWSNLAKEHVASMDATGKVVRPMANGKKLLYYEISFPNPSKGGSTIPIAGLLTESQAQPMILHFLRKFQYAEKAVKHNTVQPVLFNTDWGLAILLSLMIHFNLETMPAYIDRCWKIVTGEATEKDMQKTVFHICLSHHMRLMKKLCLDFYKQDFTYGMYLISLLVNARTLAEFEEIWRDITYIVLSENLTDNVISCSRRIDEKINSLDSNSKSTYSEYLHDMSEEIYLDKQGEKTYREEERDLLSKNSNFKSRAQHILNGVELEVSRDQSKCSVKPNRNSRYSVQFVKKLMSKYIQTYPLWSNIMLGDLKRHSSKYAPFSTLLSKVKVGGQYRSAEDPIRTTSCQEQSFSVLKNNFLNNQTNQRVDDFANILESMYFSIQIRACRQILKLKSHLSLSEDCSSSNGNSQVSTSQTVERNVVHQASVDKLQLREHWNKSGTIPTSGLPNKLGVFQQRPSKPLSLVKTKSSSQKEINTIEVDQYYCGMPNVGNSCWLNSFLQALCHTKYVTGVIVKRANSKFDVESKTSNTSALQESLIKVWTHMIYNSPTDVPSNLMNDILREHGIKNPAFQKGTQCDPFDFLVTNNDEFSDLWVNSCYKKTCLKCRQSTSNQSKEHALILSIPDLPCTVAELLLRYNKETETITKSCAECKHDTAELQTSIDETSDVLPIMLKRYNNARQKFFTEVTPDLDLLIDEQMYRLKSVVYHSGETLDSGHYITYLVHDSLEGSVLVKCNDKTITKMENVQNHWPKTTKGDSYFLFYEKTVAKEVSPVLSDFCAGVYHIDGFKKAMSNVTSKKGLRLLDIEPQRQMLMAIAVGDSRKLMDCIGCDNHKVQWMGEIFDMLGQFLARIPHQLNDAYFWIRFILYFEYSCTDCGHLSSEVQNGTTIVVEENRILDANAIYKGLRNLQTADLDKNSCSCECVEGTDSLKCHIFSLPNTLVVRQKNSKEITKLLDLTWLMVKTYCCLSKLTYQLECVLVQTIDGLIVFRARGDTYLKVVGRKERSVENKYVMNTIQTYGEAVFLYNKKEHCEKMVLPSMKISKLEENILLETHPLHVKEELSLGCAKVSPQQIRKMLSQEWYSLDEINIYMKSLSLCENGRFKDTLFVQSEWLANSFFKDGKISPTFFPESILRKKEKWHQYRRVVIPGNVGSHWVAYVIDFKMNLITFCNSLKGKHLDLMSQIVNFISILNVYYHGKEPTKSAFKVCYLNEQADFPFQTDSNSCGPYVCLMVKSVLLNERFIFDNQKGRNTVVNDVISCAADEQDKLNDC